jgi:hypothetical protein
VNSAVGQDAGLDESTAEIERPAPHPARPAGTRYCENCGTALAGPYCSQCGQRHHEHPVHSFRHFLQEATEDLTHADSRLWQTVYALLLRPGFLTEEFLAGRRVRYLPPVRLYLVVSVIFFLLVGLQSWLSAPAIHVRESRGSFRYDVAAAGAAPIGAAPATLSIGSVCEKISATSPRLGAWCGALAPRIERSWRALNAQGGIERLNAIWLHGFERAMFVFLPLLALLMTALYRKPRRYYVEHLLFLVHNQVCLFLVLGAYTLLGMLTTSSLVIGTASTALWVYVSIYFYLSMRRVYGESPWRTVGKLAALSAGYFGILLLMLAVILTYGFLVL